MNNNSGQGSLGTCSQAGICLGSGFRRQDVVDDELRRQRGKQSQHGRDRQRDQRESDGRPLVAKQMEETANKRP